MGNELEPLVQLQQEHAIYKHFFLDMLDRPLDGQVEIWWKAKAFDVQERLRALDAGTLYYDPSWINADRVLFPLPVAKG